MTTENMKQIKKQKLRNNEYYNFQDIQDTLYKKSTEGFIFDDLMTLITRRENILLAFRNIKNNKGSKTKGTNSTTIDDVAKLGDDKLIEYIRERLVNFIPHSVRRKEIKKDNGKIRPLGIPTMEDRMIQQCIKQVLEPIAEAKFYKHSYGFRPNRSAEHAIARSFALVTTAKLHYVVDIDIKSFFDNVDHGKLLKQMWTLGIRDKKLLKIISKLLRAEVEGYGIQEKGTPQGGIISPLLSNIVLNELDWWISSQWENLKTINYYQESKSKWKVLKKTNLKEMRIVRYCDDFKIFCRNAKDAQKVFVAVKKWIKERLNLDISPEKSKVVNLRKNHSEFLGFKLKAKRKRKTYVAKSHICDKAKKKIIETIKKRIKEIKSKPNIKSCNKYNSTILGMHNYYKIASNVNIDFKEIAFLVKKNLYNGTRNIRSSRGVKSDSYKKLYGRYNYKPTYIANTTLFPIAGVITRPSKPFSPEICQYTKRGREKIHKNLINNFGKMVNYLLLNPVAGESIEYNDNRISLYIGQKGKCGITGNLLFIDKMEVHHKIPKCFGGTDKYSNLIFISEEAHILIHSTRKETIEKYKEKLNLDIKGLNKINELRIFVGNCMI